MPALPAEPGVGDGVLCRVELLLGTLVGLLVIPGLYYLFATLADRRKLLPDERNMPLSEVDQ